MSRLVILSLCLAVGVCVGTFATNGSSRSAITPSKVSDEAESMPRNLSVAAGAARSERLPVQDVPASSDAEDPCVSLQIELGAAIICAMGRDETIARLNEKLAAVMRERDRLLFGEDTPYGAFLLGYEAEDIHDAEVLVRIEDWLRQFPVFLGAGEATWIAERTAAKDWKLYGRSSEVALIRFLGPDRLVRELPPARVAELRAYYADEALFN